MTESRPTVIIIGAGFSGTVLAANILRAKRPASVVLVNRFGPMGRGVAFGTRMESHLLNVRVGLMSAFPDNPEHFLRFARAQDPALGADDFVPRSLYGHYLEALLDEAHRQTAPESNLECVVGEAVAFEHGARGAGLQVRFADGSRRRADRVALALGNYPPADPEVGAGGDGGSGFYASERYVRDPWARGALDVIQPGERVLLIGTGLTMLDLAIDLAGRGGVRQLHAVSRHGLLPQPHVAPAGHSVVTMSPLEAGDEGQTVRRHLRSFRRRLNQAQGGDWRDLLGSLRAITPRLWQALPLEERARFLRHLRPYWESHRHRAAPATAAAIAALTTTDRLRVIAGRISGYALRGDGVEVTVRRRGSQSLETVQVDRVVNCTGPVSDVRRLSDPLIRSLLQGGWIRPDPLGLGIETSDDGAVLDAEGRASQRLFLVGPLLRARFWEATAVPELREHAARLADLLQICLEGDLLPC